MDACLFDSVVFTARRFLQGGTVLPRITSDSLRIHLLGSISHEVSHASVRVV